LENEAAEFFINHSLSKPEDDEDLDSDAEEHGAFTLREVEEEAEDDNNLSLDNIEKYKEKFEEDQKEGEEENEMPEELDH
jgi:hypothetical protein